MKNILVQYTETVEIQMSSEKMLTFLINDILDFAQVRSSKFRKVSSQFVLKNAVSEVINILKFKAESMQINVECDFSNFTDSYES